jgi:hypothetical protein
MLNNDVLELIILELKRRAESPKSAISTQNAEITLYVKNSLRYLKKIKHLTNQSVHNTNLADLIDPSISMKDNYIILNNLTTKETLQILQRKKIF